MSWYSLTQKSRVVEKIQLADIWVNSHRHTPAFPLPASQCLPGVWRNQVPLAAHHLEAAQ